MELDRLPHAHPLGDRQRAAVADQAEDVADEEVAAPEVAAVFVDDPADVQAILKEALLVRREGLPQLLQMG